MAYSTASAASYPFLRVDHRRCLEYTKNTASKFLFFTAMNTTRNSLLIFIPTYNERDNIIPLYTSLRKNVVGADILFCDDNSPDGTGKVIDELVANNSHVFVMHRLGKLGLGTAQAQGFAYAREHGYESLLIMDADGTHDPVYIPAMIAQKEQAGADVVIGSRYAGNAAMHGWNKMRLPFTYFWRNMLKYGLGLPYDSTGAFRLYKVAAVPQNLCQKCTNKGFGFGTELLYYLQHAGRKITEVPIQAHSRVHGQSKLSPAIMREVCKTYFKLLGNRIKTATKRLFFGK